MILHLCPSTLRRSLLTLSSLTYIFFFSTFFWGQVSVGREANGSGQNAVT